MTKGATSDAILKRLKIPNHQRQRIVNVIAVHAPFQAAQMPSTLRRMMGAPFPLLLELHRLDGLGVEGAFKLFVSKQCLSFLQEKPLPEPWISGRDLIEEGMKMAFGHLLTRARSPVGRKGPTRP